MSTPLVQNSLQICGTGVSVRSIDLRVPDFTEVDCGFKSETLGCYFTVIFGKCNEVGMILPIIVFSLLLSMTVPTPF